MSEDEIPSMFLKTGGNTSLNALSAEDLDPYSVEDLSERISRLETEIERARAALERKKSRRSDADALFSFKGN